MKNNILIKSAKFSDYSLLKKYLKNEFQSESLFSFFNKNKYSFYLIIYNTTSSEIIGIINILNVINPYCINIEISLKKEFNNKNTIKEVVFKVIKYLEKNTDYQKFIFKVNIYDKYMITTFNSICDSNIIKENNYIYFLINKK